MPARRWIVLVMILLWLWPSAAISQSPSPALLDAYKRYHDRVPARGVRALRSTRLPAGRAGTFRLPRWAA